MNSLYHKDMYNFDKPINSYWESTIKNDFIDSKTLDNDSENYDIVIVGGGYTGLSCALQLRKKFKYNVCVLESGHYGWGSSGRNGGFLCIGPTKLSIKQLINRYGLEETKYFYQNQIDGTNFTKTLIKEFNIDCDLVGDKNFEVAHNPIFTKSIKEYANDLTNYFGIKTKFYSQSEFNEIGHIGNEQFGAISYEPGCAINPLKFLRGLAKENIKNNVSLYSKSKAIKIEKNDNLYNIITEKGSVKTPKLVFAINGFYKDDIFPKLNNRIIPAISNIIVTRPLNINELKEYNFFNMNPILNARNLLFYYRLLPDNRILFGARGDLKGSKESSLKMSKWIEKRFRDLFPNWSNIDIEYRWSGFTAITRDLTPSLGKLPDEEIYHSFGYHANGVNTAPWCGKELANFIGGSNHHEMRISKIFQGLPKRFPFAFLRLFYLRIAYIYYSLVDK